jgi:arylsulfatase A-like enzyme
LDQISEDTFIVITGDQGEAMWEHPEMDKQFTDSRPNYGVGHGGTPFDEVARVPFAIIDKGEQVKIDSDGWPSLIDVPKTLANRVAENEVFNGVDIIEEDIPEERDVFCEGVRYGKERESSLQGGKESD